MKVSKKEKIWQTSHGEIDYSHKTLVMAILNVTPDSFSDGGKFNTIEKALKETEQVIKEGADILDIGGESTRPDSKRVTVEEEISRVVPIIEEIKKRFDIPISIDTSKSEVAKKAIEVGAEIINDISGLRFDGQIAKVAAKYKTGLILMHLQGKFETMHKQRPTENIMSEVANGLNLSIENAERFGVRHNQICLDVGIGFSKTPEQNLELIGKLDRICTKFCDFPIMVGTSRKSFIGKTIGDVGVDKRLHGTIATNVISVWNGADVVRIHDIKPNIEAIRLVEAIAKQKLRDFC